MDEDLRKHLEGTEARLADAIRSSEERVINVAAGDLAMMQKDMREAFERIDARLNRHGEMLANGTRALGGLVDYVERADANYAALMRDLK